MIRKVSGRLASPLTGGGTLRRGCSVRGGMLNASPVFSQVEASLSAYLVWKPLSAADSVMVLFGESGHVAMRASKAFHVGLLNLAGDESLPVYFGASSESGFAFMGAEISSAVNPWTTGWTVSPDAYGLHFVWDGTTSTKSYPAEGNATLHIEVVQNTTANPQVVLKDTTVFLTLPEMEISLPEIPEFYIVESASDTATSDLGEDPLSVKAQAFYPQDGSALSVHAESARTGYAEWDFGGDVLLPRDPSFAADGATGFAEDRGIVVLDADKNLVGGSCAEMEDETSALPKARAVASDVRDDRLASEIHIAVENLGSVALKNFDLQYCFYVGEGFSPVLDVNHLGTCLSAELENFGAGRYAVNVHCAHPIGAGNRTALPVNFTLHLSGWASAWNADDDPSHFGLGAREAEARGIGIFDSLGNRIYGDIPVWPETLSVAEPTSARSPGESSEAFEKNAVDETFRIARSPDGILLSLKGAATLSLDLVNAIGLPVKSIFRGTLPAGEKFLPVDWTGIDLSATYLVLRVDGNIKTTMLSDVKEN